jgi:hypothetical protein
VKALWAFQFAFLAAIACGGTTDTTGSTGQGGTANGGAPNGGASSGGASSGGGGTGNTGGGTPGAKCVLNSDCAGALACLFGTCHTQCQENRDCPQGQTCVQVPDGAVCQLPTEATCNYNSDCRAPLICGADRQCRVACAADTDCVVDQRCEAGACVAR